MKYMGIDNKLGDKRSAEHVFLNRALPYDNKQRNTEIAKRLAIGSQIHDGGVVGLIGLNHTADVARLLPVQFASLPILKNYQEALVQFRCQNI